MTPPFFISRHTRIRRMHKIIALKVLLLLPLLSGISHASVIYDFIGNCTTNCLGVAHGTLVLKETYIPGTELGGSDYISWQFSSSAGAYNLNDPYNFGENGMSGILPIHIGQANFFLDFGGENTYFETGNWRTGIHEPTNGHWLNTGPEPSHCHIRSCDDFPSIYADGENHFWIRRIPEPGSLMLMLIGIAGLVATRNKNKHALP